MLITATELKHSQMHLSPRVFWRIQYFVSYIAAHCGVSTAAKSQELFLCVQMFIGACQERLQWNLLLCCWGVGAPLGLSVLVLWFPASQHFAGGLRGNQGGHMTGPCRAELVGPIVLQQTHHFGVLLSPHCQPPPQHDGGHGSGPDVPSPH